MTRTARTATLLGRARRFAGAALGAAACIVSAPARAQAPPAPPSSGMTVLATPADATITLHGPSELLGLTPLDLGSDWTGRYSVLVQAPGHAAAEGVLYFPGAGGVPRALSDPSGLHGGVMLRALYPPGAAALMSHRTSRGAALLAAGVGGLGALVRDQLEYSGKKDDADPRVRAKALDFRYARDRWGTYTAAVWGMSAIDHIVHPRMDVVNASPTQITVSTPGLTRTGLVTRSMLVPGAGQDAAGYRLRGAAWLGGTLISGAAWMTAVESHRRIQTKLAEAQSLLLTATTPAEVADRQKDVDHFNSREDDSRKLVNKLALTTLAVYVVNVLDAGFLNPGDSAGGASKVSLAPVIGVHRSTLALNVRF